MTSTPSRAGELPSIAEAIAGQHRAGPPYPELSGLLREMESCLATEPFEGTGSRAALDGVGPLLLEAPVLRRAYDKPRGYPGDYGVMEQLYSDERQGDSEWAIAVQAACRGLCASRAVRSRVDYLVDLLRATAARTSPRVPRVLSLGCGSAAEIERYRRDANAPPLELSLLDQDTEALELAATHAAAHDAGRWNAQVVVRSVRELVRGEDPLAPLPPQDLIYASGLCDYFSDAVTRRLVQVAFEHLRPGGLLYVGNFGPEVTTTGLMARLLDWHVVLRGRAELLALAPAGSEAHVESEPEGLNLFLVARS